jgi:hypothetical protein
MAQITGQLSFLSAIEVEKLEEQVKKTNKKNIMKWEMMWNVTKKTVKSRSTLLLALVPLTTMAIWWYLTLVIHWRHHYIIRFKCDTGKYMKKYFFW